MAKLFDLHIMTPEKTLYKGEAVSLIAPSESGYFGVLADHAPFIANLASGRITLKRDADKWITHECAGKGFIEVLHNQVTILL